ncbi:MAG TPA: HD domain-containing phosphohydrolase, partial [Longimicrobium sp.]|nr:HD domain-containing phosphohydrolase [Longimicrobium sp.]
MTPRPLHVLVADDDPGVRSVLRSILAGPQYRVAEVDDGVEALRVFEAHGADLILSDLQMPGMSGLDLLRRVRALDDTVAFIILTGAGTVQNAVQALRLQADDYLVKPFHVDEVALAAERAVSYRRLLRENRSYQLRLEERVAEQAGQIEGLVIDALRTLATAIETRDEYTGGHVERVARYAAATGRELGLHGEELRALWIGALLHDVGKIGVPDHILRKPGQLTFDEYAEIKRHPEVGAAIMERSSFLRPGLHAVLHHQEHWDGSGYPYGLRGDEIALQGRIVAVVDAYDALISVRPYRDSFTAAEAMDEIRRCAGTH